MLYTTKDKRILLPWGEDAETWSYKNPTPASVIYSKDEPQQIGACSRRAKDWFPTTGTLAPEICTRMR